jgi:DNA-binding LytR/AlgR family response regulator
VDDEPSALDVLRAHVTATPMLELAGECHHAMGAFDFLQRQPVDLLFLDIRMPQLLGTDFIKSLSHPPQIIFTTAYREYAMDGFELNAVDFLLKPISLDRFLRAVQKALHPGLINTKPEVPLPPSSPRFLYFRSDRKMVKVLTDNIRYVESLKDYVKIFHGEQPVITKQTIMAVNEMLPSDEFIRVHRSFIVATRFVTSWTPHAVFIGKEEIPVGPLYRNEVSKRLAAGV